VGRGFGEGRVGPAFSEKPTAFLSKSDGGQGASCVFIKGKGPQGVGRRKTSDSIHETLKAVYQRVNEFENSAFLNRWTHIRSHVLWPRTKKRKNMQHRNLVGILVLALIGTVAAGAQVKEMPRTPVKPVNQPSVVDINAAPEADFVSIGIERTAAKKIIEGRPWRSKRDLLTKQVLTKEQYEKVKDSLVARRPKKS